MWISHQKILIVKMVFQQIYPRGIYYLVAKFLLIMVVTFRFNNYVSARKSSTLVSEVSSVIQRGKER